MNASISSIDAYKQAVISAQSSLDASEAGYQVGTRTIVDVLDATTTLFNAKQQLSNARYSYLINQLNIKYALGTLNEQDLQQLNSALGKEVTTSPEVVAPENSQQTAQADSAPRLNMPHAKIAWRNLAKISASRHRLRRVRAPLQTMPKHSTAAASGCR